MIDSELIDKILNAHLAWRQNLLKLAYSGENSGWTTREKAGDPTACEMGQLLLKIDKSSSSVWSKIDDVHKQFHQQAALIYALAEKRNIPEVEKLLNPVTGDFIQLTLKLTELIRSLK